MPKGNQIPGLPINDEAVRQFLCAHVFDTLDTATRSMDIETSAKLAEALIHEIEHSLAIVDREKRWVRLTGLLIKPHNNEYLSEAEVVEANNLCRRQGLDPALLD